VGGGLSGVVVVPDGGGEGNVSLRDADGHAAPGELGGPGAVADLSARLAAAARHDPARPDQDADAFRATCHPP